MFCIASLHVGWQAPHDGAFHLCFASSCQGVSRGEGKTRPDTGINCDQLSHCWAFRESMKKQRLDASLCARMLYFSRRQLPAASCVNYAAGIPTRLLHCMQACTQT